MEETLTRLGLSGKEAKIYLSLLETGPLTAQEIAKTNKETRTNTYMVLDRLVNDGLVRVDEASAVKRFSAADPAVLKSKLAAMQQELERKNTLLASALPDLSALFRLSHHKPGVLYLEGIEGFKSLLNDNAKLKNGTIDLIASEGIIQNKEAWELLQKGIIKRRAKGVKTRGLFYAKPEDWNEIKKFEKKGYEVRRWGNQPLPGEVVIYGDKVAFTIYRPSIIVTIMSNEVMAETFRTIFNQIWSSTTPTLP